MELVETPFQHKIRVKHRHLSEIPRQISHGHACWFFGYCSVDGIFEHKDLDGSFFWSSGLKVKLQSELCMR